MISGGTLAASGLECDNGLAGAPGLMRSTDDAGSALDFAAASAFARSPVCGLRCQTSASARITRAAIAAASEGLIGGQPSMLRAIDDQLLVQPQPPVVI